MDACRQFLKIKMDYEKTFQAVNKHWQVILCLLSGPVDCILFPASYLERGFQLSLPFLFRIGFTTQEYILSHCCFYTLHERRHAASWSSETHFGRSRTAFRVDTALGWFSLAVSSISQLQKYTVTHMNGAFATLMNTFPCRYQKLWTAGLCCVPNQ